MSKNPEDAITSGKMDPNKLKIEDNDTIIEERNQKGELIQKYIKGKFLGKGGFAKCYEFVTQDTKKLYAAKIISKASLIKNRAKQKLMSEIKIHRSLHHQNIVQFEHFFEDNENVYILLEMCSNQTLNELIRRRKRLTELEVQCYMLQILSSLKYLHAHRVIHRDLKLGNLFLSEKMEIKLGDFGLATKLEYEGERKRTICGTPNYIAPEILEGKDGHSYEVDVWSLGVILYTFLIGKPPFETSDVKTTYKRIRMNAYTFPEQISISPQAKDLITKILTTDPTKRPNLDQMISHEFFTTTGTIPKLLPVSTLACPPSASYLKQFVGPSTTKDKERESSVPKVSPRRLESTMPAGLNNRPSLKEKKDFMNTDRISLNNASGQNIQSIPSSKPEVNSFKGQTQRENYQPLSSRNKDRDISPPSIDHLATSRNNFEKTERNPMTARQSSAPRLMSANSNHHEDEAVENVAGADIWVKRWVDYSSKYGLGYLLSNGCIGVFFNDSSKILLEKRGKKFIYVERKGTDKQDIITEYTLLSYPKDLEKKVTLLKHFKSYLEGEELKSKQQDDVKEEIETSNPLVYVKKWMRTKHAIMFRMSNKVVQVIFQDHTEIVLSSELKVVTYVNKKHERLHYPLSSALQSKNQEMAKRLKYTKDILTHLIGNNNQNQPGSTQQTEINTNRGGYSTQNLRSSSNMRFEPPSPNKGGQITRRETTMSGFENINPLKNTNPSTRSSFQNLNTIPLENFNHN